MDKIYIVMDYTETDYGEVVRVFNNKIEATKMVTHMTTTYGDYKIEEWQVYSTFDSVAFEKGQ